MKTVYNDDYYKKRNEATSYSANRILSIVLSYFNAKSAVDFGCGVGAFLSQFSEITKSDDVVGIDGDYVNRDYLEIPKVKFMPYNLNNEILINRRFDLAISLEVAEHLTADRARGFVKNICSASDVVLFSAACRMQGGEGHINEQPLSYWQEMFKQEGYELLDIIRQQIWYDRQIPAWYRQNAVMFVKREIVKDINLDIVPNQITDIIHPELYEAKSKIFDKIVASPVYKFQRKLYLFLHKVHHFFVK